MKVTYEYTARRGKGVGKDSTTEAPRNELEIQTHGSHENSSARG